jgi:hypothetical protein
MAEVGGAPLDEVPVVISSVGALFVRLRLAAAGSRNDGQAFVEYVLVLSLVAIGIALITQWGLFSSAVHASLQRVIDELQSAGS